MRCPVDKNDMIIVEHQKIELDYCNLCAGVWFDSEELELLVSTLEAGGIKLSVTELLTPNEAKTSEARRRCPVCGHKMDKAWLGKEPKVLIDSCPLGDGLWFDGGELHSVLHQMGITSSKDVISFLGDAFQGVHEEDMRKQH
jgi:uncharacterized protein